MLKYIGKSIIITIPLLFIFGFLYPVLIWGIGFLFPNQSNGLPIKNINGDIIGYENIAQKFTDDKYFWSRPSFVDYNASSTGGSNFSPTNQDYLAQVETQIDEFLKRNPQIKKQDIPSDLVTYSGSGLDPHISVQAAYIQIPRISEARGISEETLTKLVEKHIEEPYLGFLGTRRINVLKLNIELDSIFTIKEHN